MHILYIRFSSVTIWLVTVLLSVLKFADDVKIFGKVDEEIVNMLTAMKNNHLFHMYIKHM